MRNDIEIAPIALEHADSFYACLDAVARERRFLGALQAPPIERVRGFVASNVESGAAQFVALDGGTVVGWCDILAQGGPRSTVAHRGTLGMGVLAAYRGRGIGRQLLEVTLTKALDSGMTRIELEVRADNAPAITLYERTGFVRESVKRRGMRFDDQYFDSLTMALLTEV